MITKIVVIGLGYVGIPAAALLADVDGRNVFDMKKVMDKGFEYHCVGKSGIKRT